MNVSTRSPGCVSLQIEDLVQQKLFKLLEIDLVKDGDFACQHTRLRYKKGIIHGTKQLVIHLRWFRNKTCAFEVSNEKKAEETRLFPVKN
jgi:hypothetical protein